MLKRVAICFYGQTRTFKVIKELYKTIDAEEFAIDFFVSTWDDFEDKREFDFCVSKEFIKPDVLPFKNFSERAAYTIFRVNNLKSRYEIENNFIYDYVIWVRSEVDIDKQDLLNLLSNKVHSCENYEVNILEDISYTDENVPVIARDIFFGGSSLAFDLYATGWKSYYTAKVLPYTGQTFGAHTLHPHCILRNNLQPKVVDLSVSCLINRTKPRDVK